MKTKEHEASNYVYDRLSIDNECYHCLIAEEMFLAGVDFAEQWTDFSKEEPGEEYMFTDLLLRVDVCDEIFHEVNQYVSTPELDINPHWERKIFGKIVAWRPINRK